MIRRSIINTISKIRGNSFDREYLAVKSLDKKTRLFEFQRKYLGNLLIYAYQNVPYYHDIFKDIGILNNNEIDLSKFNQIPILTKEIIRQHGEGIISKDYTTRKWYYYSSGGSTGEPIRFILDDVYNKWGNTALYYWYKDIVGIDEPEVKKVIMWGSVSDLFQGSVGWKTKIYNRLSNTVLLNSFKMTEQDMERYIKTINSYKPDLIRGYAGSLYELCRYAAKKGLSLYTPKIVVTAAETLNAEMRVVIERVLQVKVYDFYGTREVGAIAGECQRGLMHVLTFNNYVEILDSNNQSVKEGEEGRVVVTNLHNYSMPFIRYEIGDMAVLDSNECKCDNPLPTLWKITGRITDSFILENGTTIPAEYFIHLIGVVCNKGFIRKFQVVQEAHKRLKIIAIPERIIEETEKRDIEDNIKLVMGQDCKIIWDFVDEIPKTKSGKYLYTKSLVQR